MNTSDKIKLLETVKVAALNSASIITIEGEFNNYDISVVDMAKFVDNLQVEIYKLEDQMIEELNRELDIVSFDNGIDGRTCCGSDCG